MTVLNPGNVAVVPAAGEHLVSRRVGLAGAEPDRSEAVAKPAEIRHLVPPLRAQHSCAPVQCPGPGEHIGGRGDHPACGTEHSDHGSAGEAEHINVRSVAREVVEEVADARIYRAQPRVEVGLGEPERLGQPRPDLVGDGVARRGFHDQAREDVVGVGIVVAAAQRRLADVQRAPGLGATRAPGRPAEAVARRRATSGLLEAREPAGVVQQLPDHDADRRSASRAPNATAGRRG